MFIALGMIYGGILFMDYLQYNNGARAIARAAAFNSATTFDEAQKAAWEKEFFHPITNLYTAKLENVTKDLKDKDEGEDSKQGEVTVTINLHLTKSMGLSDFIGFPPDDLKPIKYTMPIETGGTTE